MAKRRYIHGDLHEERFRTYYCQRCDLLVDPEHFIGCDTMQGHHLRYEANWKRLKRMPGVKDDEGNHFRWSRM
jgi:hypothetical protein